VAGAGGSSASGGADNAGANSGADSAGASNAGADTGGAENAGAAGAEIAGAGDAGAGGAENCDPNFEACGGSCVDLDKDPKNCGMCGHDCLGGDCVLGVCQPIEIANSQGDEMVVVVDDQYVYWAGAGAVVGKKRSDNSGDITVLVPAASNEVAYFGAVVGQTFFWANDYKDKGIRGCALPSCAGGPSLLIPSTGLLNSMTYSASAATFFWSQFMSIWHQPMPGGTAEELIPTTNEAVMVASDDSFVYWSEYDSTAKIREIRKAKLNGGSSSSLATGLTSLAAMTPYGKALYILYGSDFGHWNLGTVALPNGIGTGTPTLLASAGELALGLAVDDSGVYWTQQDGTNGSIRHCSLDGCAGGAEIIALTSAPQGIATDATAVYWASTDGFIMKVAK
jgi:Stigma-specific protein, Stig1